MYRRITSHPALLIFTGFLSSNSLAELSATDSTTLTIELNVAPMTAIGLPAGGDAIYMGDYDNETGFNTITQPFCVFHNTDSVTLTATSYRSGTNGKFILANQNAQGAVTESQSNAIEYQVNLLNGNVQVGNGYLTEDAPTPAFSANNARTIDVDNCTDGNMSLELKVSDSVSIAQKDTGVYSDTLLVTVEAE